MSDGTSRKWLGRTAALAAIASLFGSQRMVKRYLLDNRCDECAMVETEGDRGFVAASDYDALAARLAEAERLLRANGTSIENGKSWAESRMAWLAASDSANVEQK